MSELFWAIPANPLMVATERVLSDGAHTFLILDLNPRSDFDPQGAPNQWIPFAVTHGIGIDATQVIETRLPALGLSDGKGGVPVAVFFASPQAWERLRGTTLPAFEEGDRRIEFPPLPPHWMWGS